MKTFKQFFSEMAIGKKDRHLTFGNKLGHHADIATNMPDADFWLIRKGSDHKVGAVTSEFHPEHIGVKIRNHNLLPDYMKYDVQHVHQQGYFKSRARGTLNLTNIRVKDVEDIPVQASPVSKLFGSPTTK